MSVARAAGSPVDHACDHLYRRHQITLVNFARLRGCDEHEAWDVVQELFLRVFRLGMVLPLSSRTEEMQRTWLLRTLRWMLINLHRNRSRLRRGGGSVLESLELLSEEGKEFPAVGTPAGEYDRQWAVAVLDRCLSRLRHTSKPAAWLAFEAGLNGTEARGTPTMRVAAHRTRVKLRKLIRVEACEESLLHALCM
jgi:DNA-directed RNA polymerase specialized sigma24 family protein